MQIINNKLQKIQMDIHNQVYKNYKFNNKQYKNVMILKTILYHYQKILTNNKNRIVNYNMNLK